MRIALFSVDDVLSLRDNPTEHGKIELITKLHHNFEDEKLTGEEKLIAEEIVRLLAADISVRIRKCISDSFSDNDALPHDVALKLANDLEDIVSLPIIENSNVLTEEDLIEIIQNDGTTRQVAVSKRKNISENLCAHIIFEATSEAVDTLVKNKKVTLSQDSCEILMKNHKDNPLIIKSLINNKRITIDQAHNLLTTVTDDLQKLLIVEYNIPSTTVNSLVHQSKEWVTLNMIRSHAEKSLGNIPLASLIYKLHAQGELTFTILVMSLSLGDIAFFEAAIAKMAEIPVENVQKLIWENADSRGFIALYNKCKLPSSMADAIYKLLMVIREERDKKDQQVNLPARILNRLNVTLREESVTNLDYLITIVTYNLRKTQMI